MRHANIAIFVPHNGCPNQCSFCNQRTISGEQHQPTAHEVRNTLEEYERRSREAEGEDVQCELAFFGGSFTAIEREYMCELLQSAQPYIESGTINGIRCSTRPDCIDEEVLGCLGRYGVTAIELGAQSMDDRVLRLNRRGHDAEAVRRAARLIKERGFELGLQMMTGLYGDSDEGARYTAQELAALEPDTVRIYPTVVLEGTELAQLYKAGEYVPQSTEGAVELCAELIPFFEKKGIRVIRVGLHASEGVESEQVAGAYHPALRELCEGRIFLHRMLEMSEGAGEIIFAVNPRDISKALGQKRCNIERLREKGTAARIVQSEQVAVGDIAVVKAEADAADQLKK